MKYLLLILLYTTTAYADTFWYQPVDIIVGNNTATAVVTNSTDSSIVCRGWFKAKTKRRVATQTMDDVLAPGDQMLLELHTDSRKDPFISGSAKIKCRIL